MAHNSNSNPSTDAPLVCCECTLGWRVQRRQCVPCIYSILYIPGHDVAVSINTAQSWGLPLCGHVTGPLHSVWSSRPDHMFPLELLLREHAMSFNKPLTSLYWLECNRAKSKGLQLFMKWLAPPLLSTPLITLHPHSGNASCQAGKTYPYQPSDGCFYISIAFCVLRFYQVKDELNDTSQTTAAKFPPWLNFAVMTFWKLSQTKERFIRWKSGILPVPTDPNLLYLHGQSHCWLLNKLLGDISVIVHLILKTTKERVSDPLRWAL